MSRIDKTKYTCCGCSICAESCPKGAISMVPDSLGFLYPIIDDSLCIDCGLCEKICSFDTNYISQNNFESPYAYGARLNDETRLMSSQSGAAFIAISDWVLDNNGVVYGAGFNDQFFVSHKRAVTKEERDQLRGSKYVQSSIQPVLKNIKNDLKAGRIVLFSGTPCQTNAVTAFVGSKLQKNLYLVDIICHGVPSPFIWRDYIQYLEKKNKSKILSLKFRDKRNFGWKSSVETYVFKNKVLHSRTYGSMFYQNINMRYSCSVCPFTNIKRPSDITIGDLWKYENTELASLATDDKGCSIMLINSPKGEYVFQQIQEHLLYKRVHLQSCMQENLKEPAQFSPLREQYETEYMQHGIDYILKKYSNLGWRYYFTNNLRLSIFRILHNIIPLRILKYLKNKF